MQVRMEQAGDEAAIHALVAGAFGRPDEAGLVDALRKAGDLVLSLVAEDKGQAIGQVALSRLKSPERALALAPLAVLPQRQGCGIGSLLVRGALDQARQGGWGLVFVMGDPDYYSRFGFSPETATPFPCAYAGPYFMALCLTDVRSVPEPVVYADPFDDLD